MTSSYLENKILDLEARLKAQSELNMNENSSSDLSSSGFGSRPGSGRRPKLLGDVSTPTRMRKQYDFPGINYQQRSVDASEIDAKMKEIMKMSGIISIHGRTYPTDINDMEHLGELGSGTCGHVVKMRHRPSNSIIAVKQMRWSGDSEENKRIYMDLEVVLKCHDCPYIVSCYGCFITDADVWICMELMSTSFDKLTKLLSSPLPEDIIGRVALGTVRALHYLKERHGVMHRDIKPSNILLDSNGNVKLCDFGISGRLVNSKAKSGNAGCAAYMAPERISPGTPDYDVRADVWSLGITLVELATGMFPYKDCKSDFEVLSRVLQDEPPKLPNNNFSPEFHAFVEACLRKDYHQRPKYNKLLDHPFLLRYTTKYVDVGAWFAHVQRMSKNVGNHQWNCQDTTRQENSVNKKKEAKTKNESDGFKSIWSSFIRSPLFHRRKKSLDSAPPPTLKIATATAAPVQLQRWNFPSPPPTPPPPPLVSPISAQVAGNTSPLVVQRFLHQQMQHMNGGSRLNRSSSMSPTLRQFDALAQELKNLRVDNSPVSVRRNTSPSPEPPPRVNKMVSPLLLRRMAYNNAPESYFTPPYHLQRYGMPPQPPLRKKSIESKSVPCSPITSHRYFKPSAWHQMDRS
ncbi:mitogen-activated protein kinase kinase [Nesidiocoris tenuis]|uniref:mitogen-activated protein kinase kinase n=1 Tax=Nesidiocoris tenuis TaxID=355587 RepID=A0ABN7BBK7_9HEMI|nr:mitogen-activated protein kinase kinase [Nesidiocoris tenuis]